MTPIRNNCGVLHRLRGLRGRLRRAAGMQTFALLAAILASFWLSRAVVAWFLELGGFDWNWVAASLVGALLIAVTLASARYRRITEVARLADGMDAGCKDRHATFLVLKGRSKPLEILARAEIEEFFAARKLPGLPRHKLPAPALLALAACALAFLLPLDAANRSRTSARLDQARLAAAQLTAAASLAAAFGKEELAAGLGQAAQRLLEKPGPDPARGAARELAAAGLQLQAGSDGAAAAAAEATLAAAARLAGNDNPALRDALLRRDADAVGQAVSAMDHQQAAAMRAQMAAANSLDAAPRPLTTQDAGNHHREAVASMLRDALEVLQAKDSSTRLSTALREMGGLPDQASDREQARPEHALGLPGENGEAAEPGEETGAVLLLAGTSEQFDPARSRDLSVDSATGDGRPSADAGPELEIQPVAADGESIGRAVLAAFGDTPAVREFQDRVPQMLAEALAAAEFEVIPFDTRPAVRAYFSELRGVAAQAGAMHQTQTAPQP